MSPIETTSAANRDPVEELAEEFLERRRRGEKPSLTEYINRCPELADDIRELFPALEVMEKLKPTSVEGSRRDAEQLGAEISSAPLSRPDAEWARLGDFRLLREIGRGGMGVVYEAFQESLKRTVALKILAHSGRKNSSQNARFQVEARSAARLNHPNIVPVYGVGEHDGVPYYAMQFIRGHGLDDILKDLRGLRGLPTESLDDPGTSKSTGLGVWPEPAATLAIARSLATNGFPPERMEAFRGDATVALVDAESASTKAETCASRDSSAGSHGAALSVVALPVESPLESPPARVHGSGFKTDSSMLSVSTDSRYYKTVARLMLQVAEALSYAHLQGVLHRDIKPSNLLLDAAGSIWVTDFGLAKVEGSDGPTRTGDIVGTIRYMAPERFDGWSDRRGDVYSLGATFYELLTLEPIFTASTQGRLIDMVIHAEPEAPRKLDAKIPRDLETIVLKSIAKEPAARYASAAALADDLKLFLGDRPIKARRSSSAEQLWRWGRRNPWLAGTTTTAAAFMIALAIGASYAALNLRAQRNNISAQNVTLGLQRDRIAREQTQGRRELFKSLVAQARAIRFSRQPGQRFDSLDAIAQAVEIGRELKLPEAEFANLRDEAIACLALPDIKQEGRTIAKPEGCMMAVWARATTRYALRFFDGRIEVRDLADDHVLARFHGSGDRGIWTFCFSPNGRYLASMNQPGAGIVVWDVDKERVVVKEPGPCIGFNATFHPDGRNVAVAREDGVIVIYELPSGKEVSRLAGSAGMNTIMYDPGGTRLAAGGGNVCRILDAKTGKTLAQHAGLPSFDDLAWRNDGRFLAISCLDQAFHLVDAETGTHGPILRGHLSGGLRGIFHPSDRLYISNSWDETLRIWDPLQGKQYLSLPGSADVKSISDDGRLLASIGKDMFTFLIDPAPALRTLVPRPGQLSSLHGSAISPAGGMVALACTNGLLLLDMDSSEELAHLPLGRVSATNFTNRGNLLVNGPSGLREWPIRVDRVKKSFQVGPPGAPIFPSGTGSFAMNRDQTIIASSHFSHCDVSTPKGRFVFRSLDDCRRCSVSPDGKWLAAGSHTRGGSIWDIASRRKVWDLPQDGSKRVEFTPDGRFLLVGDSSGLKILKVGTWRQLRNLPAMSVLASSPDGRIMACLDPKWIIHLMDPSGNRTFARLKMPEPRGIGWACFSPDGKKLIVATNDPLSVDVWDLAVIRRELAKLGLDRDLPSYSESDDSPPNDRLKRWKVTVNLGSVGLDQEKYAAMQAQIQQHMQKNDMTLAIEGMRGLVKAFPNIANDHNTLAWFLAKAPRDLRNSDESLAHAAEALKLEPDNRLYLNTLGVALYRGGMYVEAIETLQKSTTISKGELAAFDLFFLAMAHKRLAREPEARALLKRAEDWFAENRAKLSPQYVSELEQFQDEARAVVAPAQSELPEEVFAPN